MGKCINSEELKNATQSPPTYGSIHLLCLTKYVRPPSLSTKHSRRTPWPLLEVSKDALKTLTSGGLREGHGGHRVYSKDISTVYEGDCEEIVAHLRSTSQALALLALWE
jgi:hypothetical protein